ncbi:MAG: hypothetical protein AAGA00_09210, partial [Pseudomonadota bacterium]
PKVSVVVVVWVPVNGYTCCPPDWLPQRKDTMANLRLQSPLYLAVDYLRDRQCTTLAGGVPMQLATTIA